MTDGRSGAAPRPPKARGRWTSFVADPTSPGRVTRALHEEDHPQHRVRVEHDNHTLLIHISDEDGPGWTTVALDRATREWSVAQRFTQQEAVHAAYDALYGKKTALEFANAHPPRMRDLRHVRCARRDFRQT